MNPSPEVADRPARVLIVDDNVANGELLGLILEAEGYLPLTASSGEEALAMVAQQLPDLILLDQLMPGMDGYQVACSIKGNLATKNIPIIILSGLDNHDARTRAMSSGAEDFLSKPLVLAELRVRVRNLLRLKAHAV